MKTIRNVIISLAIVVGAAAACEACVRLGGAATRVDLERTVKQ